MQQNTSNRTKSNLIRFSKRRPTWGLIKVVVFSSRIDSRSDNDTSVSNGSASISNINNSNNAVSTTLWSAAAGMSRADNTRTTDDEVRTTDVVPAEYSMSSVTELPVMMTLGNYGSRRQMQQNTRAVTITCTTVAVTTHKITTSTTIPTTTQPYQ